MTRTKFSDKRLAVAAASALMFSLSGVAGGQVVPSIDIEKATNGEDADTPTGPLVLVGDLVKWTYQVTNDGDATLFFISVMDDQLGPIVCPTDTLIPDASMDCEIVMGVAEPGQYKNVARVEACDDGDSFGGICADPLANAVEDSDPSHYFGEEPGGGGGEGCTPGYWKQPHHFGSWTGYTQDDKFAEVFGVPYDKTLLKALRTGGGKEMALGRHAVAALLNAASAGVDYAFSAADVIALVQQAWDSGEFEGAKDQLAAENEQVCELGRNPGEDDGVPGKGKKNK